MDFSKALEGRMQASGIQDRSPQGSKYTIMTLRTNGLGEHQHTREQLENYV